MEWVCCLTRGREMRYRTKWNNTEAIFTRDIGNRVRGFLSIIHEQRKIVSPPDPHQESRKFLLSEDMKMNLFHIGSLPHNGLSQVRIHWMLDLVQMR
ncbi:hypothetical protein NPIL_573551 [Nephila pilipes]|uniref:Uncharacterized protein n=1 Tax=Nephila pilipes TaxID=299642 RepID=A0A8X6N9E0_NEPPI|nr:hypothetical protein NPIL_573551 [Nephila pilipes]